MIRGIPNRRMMTDYRAAAIQPHLLPSTSQATQLFETNGGNLTYSSSFGNDPLANSAEKLQIRDCAFIEKYPSFEHIFHNLVNGNDSVFRNAIIFFVDVTSRLSVT